MPPTRKSQRLDKSQNLFDPELANVPTISVEKATASVILTNAMEDGHNFRTRRGGGKPRLISCWPMLSCSLALPGSRCSRRAGWPWHGQCTEELVLLFPLQKQQNWGFHTRNARFLSALPVPRNIKTMIIESRSP